MWINKSIGRLSADAENFAAILDISDLRKRTCATSPAEPTAYPAMGPSADPIAIRISERP
jgi:hypothetical protein